MNNDCGKMQRPHLTKDQRVPHCFKQAEKILEIVKRCEGNLKTVLYNAKLARNVYRRVYALTFNVLRQNHVLNAIMKEIQLLEKEPSLRKELAGILIHELIFGKGLPGESKPVLIVKKYQADIERAYTYLSAEGNLANSGIFSIPKYVRVNTLVTTVPEVLEDLAYLGVEQILFDDFISENEYLELVRNLKKNTFLIDHHFKDLLVFHSDENLTSWSLYQKRHVFIQDKSSYIPAHVLKPEPGATVLDACAAPGMKTLHLTAIMQNKGTLYAFERDKERFEILRNMLQSGHADICQLFCEDFNSVDLNDEKFSSVEYILLDPSCSGSGMVSRMDSVTDTEESKNDARIQKLAGFQIILLKHALLFPSVKRVVYSTCSITETENEFVVHEVLNHFRHRFKLAHVFPDWPIRGSEKYEFGPLCLRSYPDKCLTNGFFVAMFERFDCSDEQERYLGKKKTRKPKDKKYSDEISNSSKRHEQSNNYKRNFSNSNHILQHGKNADFNSQTSYHPLKERSDTEVTFNKNQKDFCLDRNISKNSLLNNGTDLSERHRITKEISKDCYSFPDQHMQEIKQHKKKHKRKHEKQNPLCVNEIHSECIHGNVEQVQIKMQCTIKMLRNTLDSSQQNDSKVSHQEEKKAHKKKHKRKDKILTSLDHSTQNIVTDDTENDSRPSGMSEILENTMDCSQQNDSESFHQEVKKSRKRREKNSDSVDHDIQNIVDNNENDSKPSGISEISENAMDSFQQNDSESSHQRSKKTHKKKHKRNEKILDSVDHYIQNIVDDTENGSKPCGISGILENSMDHSQQKVYGTSHQLEKKAHKKKHKRKDKIVDLVDRCT